MWTRGAGVGGLTAISAQVVDGTVETATAIAGLPVLDVGDSKRNDLRTITFREPTVSRFSR